MRAILTNHPLLRGLLVFGVVWSGVVLLFTVQLHLITEQSFRDSFIRTLARWSPWIVLTPFVFWFTTQFPWTKRQHLFRNGIIHVLTSVCVALLAQTLFETVGRPVERKLVSETLRSSRDEAPRPSRDETRARPSGERPPREGRRGGPPRRGPRGGPPPGRRQDSLGAIIVQQLPSNLPTYWALASIQTALLFGAQLRQRERQALELETKLTQSHLDALKLQLQPHFLFNALNAISTLVYREPKTADKMIGNLSTLLRGVLDEKNSDELPLSRELELLGAYLGIEQMRFGDRVQFEQTISADCQQACVPALLLQPIVENAVRHGLEPSGKSGTIWLSVNKCEEVLQIRVEDDGVGRRSTSAKGWGIGLSNAEARLEALYGREHFTLELNDREGGGTVVDIHLPFKSSLS